MDNVQDFCDQLGPALTGFSFASRTLLFSSGLPRLSHAAALPAFFLLVFAEQHLPLNCPFRQSQMAIGAKGSLPQSVGDRTYLRQSLGRMPPLVQRVSCLRCLTGTLWTDLAGGFTSGMVCWMERPVFRLMGKTILIISHLHVENHRPSAAWSRWVAALI